MRWGFRFYTFIFDGTGFDTEDCSIIISNWLNR